jgi:hypothetical protein
MQKYGKEKGAPPSNFAPHSLRFDGAVKLIDEI